VPTPERAFFKEGLQVGVSVAEEKDRGVAGEKKRYVKGPLGIRKIVHGSSS